MAYKPSNSRFKNSNNLNIRKKRLPNRIGGKIIDARQKIILKKRKTVIDARDILAKRAKTRDARDTLLKLREVRQGEGLINTNIRPISSNIYRKTDRNGKISLITSKNKVSTNDINLAVQQQLGLISQNRKKVINKQSPMNVRKPLQHSVGSGLIRKTILNNYEYRSPAYEAINDGYYPVDGINLVSANPRIAIPTVINTAPLLTRRSQMHIQNNANNEWVSYGAPRGRARIVPSGYVDLDAPEDEEMPLVSPMKQTIFMHGSSRNSNVHSRLDTSPLSTRSHGIFSTPTKTKVVVPAGHRIVVSNLQQTVTQDDIRELFEDIGQLLVARLVRPGTAEVIYKNLKDAQKAVDTYHNRQLDGQPMKCLLVNKRPINNPTGPAIASKQGSSGIIAALNKKPVASKNNEKLVPDLQTIHKVLFQRN